MTELPNSDVCLMGTKNPLNHESDGACKLTTIKIETGMYFYVISATKSYVGHRQLNIVVFISHYNLDLQTIEDNS